MRDETIGCPRRVGEARRRPWLAPSPALALALWLAGLAGCGEARRTRVVAPTPSRASDGGASLEAGAVTKPPRAIATH